MRTLDSGRQKAGIIIDKITTIYGLEGFCVAHDFGMRSPVKTRRRKKEGKISDGEFIFLPVFARIVQSLHLGRDFGDLILELL